MEEPLIARRNLLALPVALGRHAPGEHLEIPATGKHVTFNSTDIMKVRDGLFSEHWGAADLFGLINQLKA
jgi:predicted ester cyclase